MSDWLLEELSIEGFRGINNEGTPLKLKFKPDKVNSISAPNGVGKSSIFDAVVYAITGKIKKLDDLPAAENGASFYLNRFHSQGVGTVVLTLRPAAGGQNVIVTATRNAAGNRTVSASGSADAQAILDDLNREFVLLDGKTFREFIDHKPIDRGRSFSGLLGLKRYSDLRQGLQTLANTRAINNHFEITATKQKHDSTKAAQNKAIANIREAYKTLTTDDLDLAKGWDALLARAYSSLNNIEILKPLCAGKSFDGIDIAGCVEAAKKAEGGEDREKYAAILKSQTEWTEAIAALPSKEDGEKLIVLAAERETALKETQGDALHQLYRQSEAILSDDAWSDKSVCPTCDRTGPESVLDHVRVKIDVFDKVTKLSEQIAESWTATWHHLSSLEKLAKVDGDLALFSSSSKAFEAGVTDKKIAQSVVVWIMTLAARARAKLDQLETEKTALEKVLPEKLTAVVEAIEAARRLQTNLKDFSEATVRHQTAVDTLNRVERVKKFLNATSGLFAEAESDASSRRLKAIEPECQKIFAAIMHEDIVPALKKRDGSEDISILLSKFWSLPDVSAQALLSESFRNAFAISVFLAAAKLYSSGARFLLLDDVTSSFDSGHQFHLMNVIRTAFARPAVANGPQVILLSHDTALEKLFNTNSNSSDWWHQCIQGTARTAVLPQSGAINKVKDATNNFLNVGNVDDAAPRIRQYLEYKLTEIISRAKIPVPIDLAFNDNKHVAINLIKAIEDAVKLHATARQLSLDSAQVASLNTTTATIVGNYLSHWQTGQTHMFTAASLRGVMTAIDDYALCFQMEDPAGSRNFRYYKSLKQK